MRNFLIALVYVLLFFSFFTWVYHPFSFKKDKTVQPASIGEPSFLPSVRRETSLQKVDERVTILFVGDIMLSRAVGRKMQAEANWRYPFLEIAEILRGADITFGNLEGPVSTRGHKVGSIYSFRADPLVLEGLAFAGFDVLSIANNHIWDYGKDAVGDTMMLLKVKGIDTIGVGQTYEEAHQGMLREVRGIKIVFLAYTDLVAPSLGGVEAQPAISYLSKEILQKDIHDAKARADVVIVSIHTGEEYSLEPTYKQQEFSKIAIDSGANIVVGHHSHIVQRLEHYGQGLIAYSLGNFIFDQNFSQETMQGIILKVIVNRDRIENVEIIPTLISSGYQVLLKK